MKPKVYIDGKDGTTGLQIYDHDAVKIVRYGKAAGDLDIRAQNLQ